MIGRTYAERGQPVVVLARWQDYRKGEPRTDVVLWVRRPKPHAPRNVAIRRADGTTVVRPFRGLRRWTG
ncbi:hypothetical protein [Actinopolymorpha alba]|uniref:hypothetical protein n=1 Tax=Actinopolymorpha alba TaxID=533267 RepID=UPI00036723E7|nr:hypothetical protein [Actinopolymorpha alba]